MEAVKKTEHEINVESVKKNGGRNGGVGWLVNALVANESSAPQQASGYIRRNYFLFSNIPA